MTPTKSVATPTKSPVRSPLLSLESPRPKTKQREAILFESPKVFQGAEARVDANLRASL